MSEQQTFAKGSYGKANFNSTDIDLTGWTFDVGGDDGELTHSGSESLKIDMVVNREYTGSCDGVWRFSNEIVNRQPAVLRGETGTLQLYVSRARYISIAVEIKTVSIVSEVNGLVTFTFTWKATGEPTWPTDTTFSSSSSSSSSST